MSRQRIIFAIYISLTLFDNGETKQIFWDDDEVCGATDLKVEKINKEDQVIKFSWKGLKDNNPKGVKYELVCSLSRLRFTSDLPFLCNTTDLRTLEKRKIKWKYFFTDVDQYCAIKAERFPFSRISNIVKVRTPAEFKHQYTNKTLFIIGLIITGTMLSLSIIMIIMYIRRRRLAPGVVLVRPVVEPMYQSQNYLIPSTQRHNVF